MIHKICYSMSGSYLTWESKSVSFLTSKIPAFLVSLEMRATFTSFACFLKFGDNFRQCTHPLLKITLQFINLLLILYHRNSSCQNHMIYMTNVPVYFENHLVCFVQFGCWSHPYKHQLEAKCKQTQSLKVLHNVTF